MSSTPTHAHDLGKDQWTIELLARETETPIEKVEEIYIVERSKLELVARIKTYVPVLASRRVKMILHGNDLNDLLTIQPATSGN